MRILAIETSCDETALAVLSVSGSKNPKFKIEAHNVASQIELHKQYGGVFPMMAKREHSRVIVPLFLQTLKDASLHKKTETKIPVAKIQKLLEREPEMLELFLTEIPKIAKPKIDRIAVTVGPGLEPALWVGINFARALSAVWDIPLIPTNHMEGHILSIFPEKNKKEFSISNLKFPMISLLVSGGHTEIVLIKGIGKYTVIGQTRDDAAGEAFDKVARMLDLAYPGGPEISRLAEKARKEKVPATISLPRPMLHTPDFDFSFSGLKTAVLYTVRDIAKRTEDIKGEIAREFEDAVMDVLVAKTLKAIKKYKAVQLIVGGGVAANNLLRSRLLHEGTNLGIPVSFPIKELSTDNAAMIGIAGYFGKEVSYTSKKLKAEGNLGL